MYPFFDFFGISIPAYGVMILLGCTAAFLAAYLRGRRAGIGGNDLFIIAACALGAGFLCGTLMFVFITYSWSEILCFIRSGMLNQLMSSGIVFYGGLIGGAAGGILGCRIAHVKVENAFYAILPAVPLGQAFGRIGCFLAGCCYGCETTLPIGAVYTAPIGGAPAGTPLFPVQLVEAALCLLLFALLTLYDKKTFGKKPLITAACLYAVGYGAIRFALEYLRGDSIRGFLLGLSTSQWISAVAVALGAAGLLAAGRRSRRD